MGNGIPVGIGWHLAVAADLFFIPVKLVYVVDRPHQERYLRVGRGYFNPLAIPCKAHIRRMGLCSPGFVSP